MAPRVILGQTWWNETRFEAFRKTGQHCIACGVHATKAHSLQRLEGHEVYDIDYGKGTAVYVRTVPLCHFCHCFIHDGRLKSLLRNRVITQSRYVAIIQHGNKVLAEAGLQRMTHEQRVDFEMSLLRRGLIKSWGDWRLIVFGKSYKGKFKTYRDWEKFHAHVEQSEEGEDKKPELKNGRPIESTIERSKRHRDRVKKVAEAKKSRRRKFKEEDG